MGRHTRRTPHATYQLDGGGGLKVSVTASVASSRKAVSPFFSCVLERFSLATIDSSKNWWGLDLVDESLCVCIHLHTNTCSMTDRPTDRPTDLDLGVVRVGEAFLHEALEHLRPQHRHHRLGRVV